VKGHTLGILSHAMHYDPNIWDDPKVFRPERFLGSDPSYPRSGYRPFERGLRSCLGQHLAMDEMRVALLSTVRWFDWELVDHEPTKTPAMGYTDLDTKIGLQTWQKMRMSAGPYGSVKMIVKVAERED
jgi:cytochrome P450